MQKAVIPEVFAIICLLALNTQVSAQPATANELRVLPEYCSVKWDTKDSTGQQRWSAVFGKKNWIHMHHWCIGLNSLIRAHKTFDDYQQGRFIQNVLGQFDYMEKRATPDWVLWPELHLKKGNALMLKRRGNEAAAEYIKAIKLKPDYTPPYGFLSDHYRDLGSLEEARRIIEEGLKHAPNSKLLRTKLKEIENSSNRN